MGGRGGKWGKRITGREKEKGGRSRSHKKEKIRKRRTGAKRTVKRKEEHGCSGTTDEGDDEVMVSATATRDSRQAPLGGPTVARKTTRVAPKAIPSLSGYRSREWSGAMGGAFAPLPPWLTNQCSCKDFALDTEGSKYSDSSSIPKDGFSRLLDLMTIPKSLKRLHVVFFSPDDKGQPDSILQEIENMVRSFIEKTLMVECGDRHYKFDVSHCSSTLALSPDDAYVPEKFKIGGFVNT
ncbi:hypothetical protein Syun_001043 [Stephania yunnanensis]|uniref:Uncharacterized protein n=1 Tax=Stephania yunnanensis TaxID=152371 RepID=A0AAP0LE57_9MAGN